MLLRAKDVWMITFFYDLDYKCGLDWITNWVKVHDE